MSDDIHPAIDPHDWRAYEREPIRISYQTVVMLTLFKRDGMHMGDLWSTDITDLSRIHHDLYAKAATQFGLQLEGQDCIAFWQALKGEAERRIQEWEWQKQKLGP